MKTDILYSGLRTQYLESITDTRVKQTYTTAWANRVKLKVNFHNEPAGLVRYPMCYKSQSITVIRYLFISIFLQNHACLRSQICSALLLFYLEGLYSLNYFKSPTLELLMSLKESFGFGRVWINAPASGVSTNLKAIIFLHIMAKVRNNFGTSGLQGFGEKKIKITKKRMTVNDWVLTSFIPGG